MLIDHRRFDIFAAQKLLDRSDFVTGFKQVRSAGMDGISTPFIAALPNTFECSFFCQASV